MPEGRLILRTRSPEPESEAGVRSPAILMNIRLTVLTVYNYVNVQYNMWLKCMIRGTVFPVTLGEECG